MSMPACSFLWIVASQVLKKWILLGVLGLAVISAMAFDGTYNVVRVNGSSTLSGGLIYQICDSSDTHQVDTFYSDTIDIGDYKYLNLGYELTGYSLTDSSNDSVVIDIKVIGSYNGAGKVTLLTDSANATAGALDSTANPFYKIMRIDTLGLNKCYMEMVISDSFIMGAGVDSNEFRWTAWLTQTGSR